MSWPLLLSFGWVLIVGRLAGALILRTSCGLFGEEQPTDRRALIMLPLVTIPVIACFELTGYGLAVAMHESVKMPQGFSFLHWARLPLGIQWIVLGHLPFGAKWFTVITSLCLAGILMVAWLQCKFRVGLGIFLVQWVVNFVALALVSQLAFFLLPLVERTVGLPQDVTAYLAPQAPNPAQGTHPANQKDLGGKYSQLKRELSGETHPAAGAPAPGSPPEANNPERGQNPVETNPLARFISNENKEAVESWGKSLTQLLDQMRHGAEPLVESISQSAEPITRHLPAPVNHFMDHQGGWWLVITVAFLVTVLYIRHLVNRLRKLFKKKKRKASDTWNKDLSFALGDLGPMVYAPGHTQATVRGIPARLRFAVLCPGSRDMGKLEEHNLEGLLDQIMPGLFQAVESDVPFIKVWEENFAGTKGFASLFHNLVRIPGPPKRPTKWVLVAGTVVFSPTEKVHLGLAFETEKATNMRNISVEKGNWLDLLGTMESTKTAARV